jgi:hypothetical protein
MTNWKQRRAAYVAAAARYREASRLMTRAERVLDRMLAHGVEESRAFEVAGVGLADERTVRAYREMRRARERLKSSVQDESTAAKTAAHNNRTTSNIHHE